MSEVGDIAARQQRLRKPTSLPPEVPVPARAYPEVVYLYKAVADAADGEIQVQACNADGTVTGRTLTFKVLP